MKSFRLLPPCEVLDVFGSENGICAEALASVFRWFKHNSEVAFWSNGDSCGIMQHTIAFMGQNWVPSPLKEEATLWVKHLNPVVG